MKQLQKLLVVCLWAVLVPAHGQIIEIENYRVSEADTGWLGSVNLNFSAISKVNTLYSFESNVQAAFSSKKHSFLAVNDLSFIFANNDEDFQREGYQHLRYGRRLDSTFTLEAFAQIQFDQVLRIDRRILVGAGPRINFLKMADGRHGHLGVLYMFEHEVEDGTGIVHRDHRLSMYLSASATIVDRVGLQFLTYYQPRFDRFDDFRLSSGAALLFEISGHLTYNFTVHMTYDAAPVEDDNISNLNSKVSNSFTYVF